MGQKVNPNGIRLKINKGWSSNWYAGNLDYRKFLLSDIKVRNYLTQKLAGASVSKIAIDRLMDSVKITIHSARPGVVIGKKGADIEELKNKVQKMMGVNCSLSINEIKKPEVNAKLVAENICQQIEKRVMYKKAVKRAISSAMRQGVKGIKIMIGGRLNGVEIARREWQLEGRVPLHTFKADIDYGYHEALTQYGMIGVKVWICHSDDFVSASESIN